ncbi:uncharacterized membrane protein HdeD (DUF308 family) [Streptomyces sp. SAI-135]|uniref:hypothetical protein n=1 Tax=unclassified Streptomyces TaxID=2593676 RepID=UPI0024745E94|nr:MULTISPECIES: hypothetical protein [unclassified Streptomyces]MDH6523063.1 uncharacterized membrane protein HdeD (DUF308 family) [Streptomyces sp. SAI-090]MDH6554676.1 uncharacterized membrane protein HdeD (DUF308 family) [Streptomyces sp. SAI-041]MDH6573946.1 uncharacterized membrane protein HdeD (DUF308 family) [Streptomyces sp. SAI-117]MDH6581317.1 uncharacterized membrane protein HdeD (DUF308 family) [Streptomyces sp. SAI-133]MDH6613324.1 uncharacterized membrane protein HdeD (DUF308 fa
MTTVESRAAVGNAPALRALYFVRFTFAAVWAALLFAANSPLTLLAVDLLVLYPLFDVGAAVIDAYASRGAGVVRGLLGLNIAISLCGAAGLAIAGGSGMPAILRAWGAWAIVSGLVQLIVGIVRRKMGGQWPMMLAGSLSMLAGCSFILQASAPDPNLTSVAGYMALGGIFFLISCLRLGPRSAPCGCRLCSE